MRLLWPTAASAFLAIPCLFGQASLSLKEAVSQALESHPQLSIATARVGVAQGLRTQAGLRPNPRLILQSENARVSGSPPFSYPHDADSYAFIAQTIETAGKRGYRVDAASHNVRRSELEREILRRQIIARVSAAYYAATGAIRVRDLLEQEVSGFERVVQYHRDRVKEGAMAEVNLLRIEVERDRLASSARSAGQEAERSTIALLREIGSRDFSRVRLSGALDEERLVTSIDISEVFKQRPEMDLANEGIEHAQANMRLSTLTRDRIPTRKSAISAHSASIRFMRRCRFLCLSAIGTRGRSRRPLPSLGPRSPCARRPLC